MSKYRTVVAEVAVKRGNKATDAESFGSATMDEYDFGFRFYGLTQIGNEVDGKCLMRFVVLNLLDDDATEEEIRECYGCLGSTEAAVVADPDAVKVYRKYVSESDRTLDAFDSTGDKIGTVVLDEGTLSGQILCSSEKGVIADKVVEQKIDWKALAEAELMASELSKEVSKLGN